MSEKTLGEVALEAFKANYGYCSIPWESCSPSFQFAWQAAADAIAAPMLARIAEMEGEVERITKAHLFSVEQLCDYRKQLTDAYQRGVTEEMERWKAAVIAEKSKYGVDHVYDGGARAACDNILEVWRFTQTKEPTP